MLNRIGPELDLRDLDEDQLHEIKDACQRVSVSPNENRTTKIVYSALTRAVVAEIEFRVLTYGDPLDVPDYL
ncbi:hypothetical protein [Amycolatopsis sp. cmx-8-4]|uniref:hypothetical protein n=1 Tax=Amycolatopsis sp. cmx-8-4 TaxID=2790947 RepID=UPI00397D04D7